MDERKTVRLQHEADSQAATGSDEESSSAPLSPDSLDINVEGTEISGPERGFGQLWRKQYRVRLTGASVSTVEVVRTWRERFGELWPEGNRFYRPVTGLKPGEIALADLEMPAGTRLSTGIVVTRVEPMAFAFVTPEGHTMAGEITVSAEDDAGTTVAQIEVLMRASDPLFEFGLPLGGHNREDQFWKKTLTKLAALFGVDGTPEMTSVCLDRHRQWRNATNIVHNSYLRTAVYMVTRPFRRVFGRLTARNEQS